MVTNYYSVSSFDGDFKDLDTGFAKFILVASEARNLTTL